MRKSHSPLDVMAGARYLAHIEHPIRALKVNDDWSLTVGIGGLVINGCAETLLNLHGYEIPAGRATVIKAVDSWLIDCSIDLMENGWEPVGGPTNSEGE